MMKSLLLCFVYAGLAIVSAHRVNPYPATKTHEYAGKDAGEPLIISNYLKKGRHAEARSLALVTGLTPNITSYAGFIRVDEKCDNNLFFWYFPSQNKPASDPVSVWLQGGPGSTSFFGLLTENGPYNLNLNGTLERREYSWNRNSSVIYIDNPAGTGYSYSTEKCYATDQVQVGEQLLSGIEQFFELFPELKSNDFYLTGESYAGKYVPAAAHAIMSSNSTINLKGLLIGNGLTDPTNQQRYAAYLYQLGLIDGANRDRLETLEEEIRSKIADSQFDLASDLINNELGEIDGLAQLSLYNYLSNNEPEANIDAFVTQTEVRKALHVGNATWNNGNAVGSALYADIPKSVRPWVEELVEKYRVLLYFGQLDIICAYPLALEYIGKLEWSGAKEYQAASRKIWRVDGSIAGYVKSAKTFSEVLVRNGGHMVPTNQPAWALDLYNKFIFNLPIA